MFIQPTGGDGANSVVIPQWLPWSLVAVGGAVLTVVMVIVVRGWGRRGGQTGPGTREIDAALGHRQTAAELADLKSQLIEVKKLAATVADDLDRRAERLERLIAQADEMLEVAERQSYGPQSRAEAQQGRPRSIPAPAAPSPTDDLAQRVFMLADEGRSALQIAQVLRQPVGNIELMLALRGGR